jgi:hypothetical protein
MLTCKACQKELQGNELYCPSCGSKIEQCDHIDNAKQEITKEPKENDDNRLGNKLEGQNNACAVCGTEGTVDGSMVINRFTGEEITNRNLNYFLALLYYLISLAVSLVLLFLFVNIDNTEVFLSVPAIFLIMFNISLFNAARKEMFNYKYAITAPRYLCSYCKYSWVDESQIQQNINDDYEKLRKEVKEKRQKEIEYKKDYIRSNPHLYSSCNNIASKFDPSFISGITADYYIDYNNGTIPISDLPIGARVVDTSWDWEFRTGDNHSGSGKVKPVTWIIVAKDHYEGLEPHVTLLSEELIGKHCFDNNTDPKRDSNSHWSDSGTGNATRGLRPWLNSTGIHAGKGFYRAFSGSFKVAVLETTLPNKEWKSGSIYSTRDKVFIPSTTELCDTAHSDTYQIGTVFSHFTGARADKRVAMFGGETRWYWTRSPVSSGGFLVRHVGGDGGFYSSAAGDGGFGVRPALNFKSEVLVSEIRN